MYLFYFLYFFFLYIYICLNDRDEKLKKQLSISVVQNYNYCMRSESSIIYSDFHSPWISTIIHDCMNFLTRDWQVEMCQVYREANTCTDVLVLVAKCCIRAEDDEYAIALWVSFVYMSRSV